jgi:hypothetical protein
MSDKVKTPFDYINTINNKTGYEWDETDDKSYNPFIINRGLSNNMQTVIFANMMNSASIISKKMQFDFYYHGVPKGRRFDKWAKGESASDLVKLVSETLHINMQRAAECVSLMSDEQKKLMKTIKGGR